jgi:phage terminase small subunit
MAIDSFGLTLKQRLFCEHYLSNGKNGSEAARQAGYSKDTSGSIAAENLQKPQIVKYLKERMKEVIEKAGAGIDWRIEMLKKTAEGSFNGAASKDGLINAAGVVSSISELNKMDGSYAPSKSDVKIEVPDLENVKEIADGAEKEINEIKPF